MAKQISLLVMLLGMRFTPQAQIPVIDVIKTAAVKVIKAVDLQVQRLQNETIWLQQAQQVLENTLSKWQLAAIGDWMDQQRALYADYFDELSQVKSAVASYHRIRETLHIQALLVAEYRQAYALFQQDRHFTADELDYMGTVYAGILEQSVQDIAHLTLVIQAFTTRLSDAERIALIDAVAEQVQRHYDDLQAFNNQNRRLSWQRSRVDEDSKQIGKIYGIK